MSEYISFSQNKETSEISEYFTYRYVEDMTLSIFDNAHSLSNEVVEALGKPTMGAHLKSTRLKHLYTHHGIYLGEGRVIQYSGMGGKMGQAPVEIVTMERFLSGHGYNVVPHPNASYTIEEVIERAYSRLGEDDYSIVGNNCEHFVHWCIYGVHTSQQAGATIKMGTHALLRVAGKSNMLTQVASATLYTSQHIIAYAKGEITRKKFLNEVHHTGLTTLSTVYYSTLGQAMIPVPVFGAVIGATVGFYVGNLLHRSGLIALGESNVVKIEKEKRERIEEMCIKLEPMIEQHRKALKQYIEVYFSDRKEIFDQAFDKIDEALANQDDDIFLEQLCIINAQYGHVCENVDFEELVHAAEPPRF